MSIGRSVYGRKHRDAVSGTSAVAGKTGFWPGRMWQGGGVTEPTSVTQPAEWLSVPDIADRLELPVSRVHQMIREGALIGVRREGALRVPAELVANRTVLKHLPGVLTLLHDAGYSDEEALRWLYHADETLPGTPAEALGGSRATEVKRRAQALGF
jgi:hypothetical protein